MPQDLVLPACAGREAKLELERLNACVLGVIFNRGEDYTPSFLRRFASRS